MGQIANFSVEQLEDALKQTLEAIDEDYEDGYLTDDEANDLEEEALEEYEDLLDEADDEEDYEDEEFSVYDGELANFSAGTVLGNAIMEHIVAIDPEDPESTIVALADNLGLVDDRGYELDEEQAIESVLGLMTGAVIPDESIIVGLADNLDLSEDDVEEICDLTEAELEDEEDFEDEDDYNDYDGDYVDELEEEIEGLEGELEEVGDIAEEAFSRIENMEAQFSSALANQEIGRQFDRLERDAYALVESGQMPPAIFDEHYGNFESQEQQLAAFSTVCDRRGVTPEAELYRLGSLNETYAGMEPNINFSQMSYSDPKTQDYEEDDAMLAQAARNVRNRLSNADFGKPLDLRGLGGVTPQAQPQQAQQASGVTGLNPFGSSYSPNLVGAAADPLAAMQGQQFRSF